MHINQSFIYDMYDNSTWLGNIDGELRQQRAQGVTKHLTQTNTNTRVNPGFYIELDMNSVFITTLLFMDH